MHRTALFSTLSLGLLLAACGDDAPQQTGEAPHLVIGADSATAQVNSLYQMPTPNELFRIVRDLDGAGQKSALSPLQKADRFATLGGRLAQRQGLA